MSETRLQLLGRVSSSYVAAVQWLETQLWRVGLVLSFGFVLLITAQVILRYAFSSSIVWANEVATYMLIWVVMLLIPSLVLRDRHLQIEIVFRRFSTQWQWRVRLVQLGLILVFSLVFAYSGYEYATTAGTARRFQTLDIDIYWAYISLAIGGVLLAVFTVAKILQVYQNPDTIQEDYEKRFDLDEEMEL